MSDRIAVMCDGRIEQLDVPLAIYDRPASAFVADFIGDMNFLDGVVSEVDGGTATLDVGGGAVAPAVAAARPPARRCPSACGPRSCHHRPGAGRRERAGRHAAHEDAPRRPDPAGAELPDGRHMVALEQRGRPTPTWSASASATPRGACSATVAPLLLDTRLKGGSVKRDPNDGLRLLAPLEHEAAARPYRAGRAAGGRRSEGRTLSRREALGLGGLALAAAACGGSSSSSARRQHDRGRHDLDGPPGGQADRGRRS